MPYLDRSFGAALILFTLGSLASIILLLLIQPLRGLMISLLEVRMIAPVETVSRLGDAYEIFLVFVNNSIPAVLSFAYPYMICKVNWTPPLGEEKRCKLLSSFTYLCAFLTGFFGFGAALSIAWLLGGIHVLFTILSQASIHGPVEIAAVLLCESEPMRLTLGVRSRVDTMAKLRMDLRLLVVCLFALAVAAWIEVHVRL